MDFIFIIGPSAVGKTTLAKALYEHYHGVYLEQNMVPEFAIPQNCDDEGVFEEEICWENVLLQLKYFYQKGFKNIVALDFDDLRTREIPQIFKGYDFITLKLVSGDPEQIRRQMIHRHENEGGLFLLENVEPANAKIMGRKLLPNEIQIDISGKTAEEVFNEAVKIIDSFKPLKNYDYSFDDERNYMSWVQSRGLNGENDMYGARLELVLPTEEYESQVMSYRAEMLENGDSFDGCAGLETVESYGEWPKFEERLKNMYGEGYVPSEVYLAVRKSDGRVVGIIDYRLQLSDFLFNFGGNIGYCVRPSERRKGYAKEMLALILERCRETGEKKVLVCCEKYNEASAKTIIVNGGVLENEVADTVGLTRSENCIIQRYWINLF